MRMLAAVVLALLAAPLAANSPSIEALRAASGAAFYAADPVSALRFVPSPHALRAEVKGEPVFEVRQPGIERLSVGTFGAAIARVSLPAQLDRHRDLLVRQLGGANWDVGIAADAGVKNYFVTFRRGGRLVIRQVGDLDRLRGEGIDLEIEPGLVYNFKVQIRIFDPIRGSKLQLTPTRGTQGPRHEVKTGAVLDSMKAHSHVFSADGVEYWLGYSTDVDPATSQLGNTRTLVFMHEDGLNSKLWPVAESAVPVDQPVQVDFDGARFVLLRAASGELLIQRP